MPTEIRDQIIDILAQGLPAEKRADHVLDAVADWLTTAELDFRLALALSEAAPGKFDHGVHGDAELTDAARAVVIEAAKTLRPKPLIPPSGEDRWAVLASDGRTACVNTVNTGGAR